MNIILQLCIVAIIAVVIVGLVIDMDTSGTFDNIKSFGGLPKVEMPTWNK